MAADAVRRRVRRADLADRSTAAGPWTSACGRSSPRSATGPARQSGSTSSARTSPGRRSPHFGTEAQKERYLRPILTGEEIWCQLFSEPEAGSDLASLRTKATRVKGEGGWRINGQKIWTSRAQLAAHAILLARTGGGTGTGASPTSCCRWTAPGVTVRPLAHMLGEAEFNEVFLDDVLLPDEPWSARSTAAGGWPWARWPSSGSPSPPAGSTPLEAIEDIIADIAAGSADAQGRPLGADPRVRQQVADLWARALVHHAIGQRVISGAAAGEPPGPVTSIGKLYFCPLVEDLADFRLSLEPLGGQFAPRRRAGGGAALAAAGQPGPGHRHRRADRPSSSATSSPSAFSVCRGADPMTYTWRPVTATTWRTRTCPG